MARMKCDAAQRRDERPAERHGEHQQRATPERARRREICTKFGSTAQISRSARATGMRAARSAGQQAAGRSHQRGEEQTAGEQRRRDAELERDFAEAREVGRAGRQAVHRQRQQAADDAADERQRDRLGEKRGHDAHAREAERAQRADLARAVRDRGVHRVHRAEHRADRQDQRDERAEHADHRRHRRATAPRSSPARAAAAGRGADRRRSPPRTSRTPTGRSA